MLGNLLSVELPDQTLIEYIVDGRNRRIGKKVNGVIERTWLYKDQLNPDGGGNVVARFVYGAKGNVPEYMVKNGDVYRFIPDHLGSPRLIVNAGTGAVVQRMEEDEFGNVVADTSAMSQPFGFAGGLYECRRHRALARRGDALLGVGLQLGLGPAPRRRRAEQSSAG